MRPKRFQENITQILKNITCHLTGGRKNIILKSKIIVLSLAFITLGFFHGNNISALSYQTATNINFTFNPSLSISLSGGGLIISNLIPGTSSDSNIITVSVSSNTVSGYYLVATAGTSSTNTNLTHTENSQYHFTNLATTAGIVNNLLNIPDDYWGYSYSADSGITWVSGNVGNTAVGYAGLPLDNNDYGETGVILIDKDSATNSSVQFKIGAKASPTQPSGEYTNIINFYAIAYPNP